MIDLPVPNNKEVPWKVYSRRMGVLMADNVMARTAYAAWQESRVPLPFSEVECVGPK